MMERFLKIGAVALAFLAVAALAATAVLVITTDREGEVSPNSATPYPPAPAYAVYIPEIPDRDEALPELTQSQIETVKAAVNSDESLKYLLNGVSFAIIGMGVWIAGKERELVGALVVVGLDNPVSYNGYLPSVGSYDNPPDKPELYTPGEPLPTQARGIEELTIMVDLHTREVVSIEISKAAEVTFGGYEPIATVTVADDVYIGKPPDSARDAPALTEDQIDEVKSILNSDERLKAALSGESFAVTKIGPWGSGERLIGALVAIELDNPVSYTGSFPAVGFPPDGGGYRAGEVSVQADGIESLEMLVDLDKRIVASIRIEKATGEVCIDYGKPQWGHGPLGGVVHMMIWTLTAPKSPICNP